MSEGKGSARLLGEGGQTCMGEAGSRGTSGKEQNRHGSRNVPGMRQAWGRKVSWLSRGAGPQR